MISLRDEAGNVSKPAERRIWIGVPLPGELTPPPPPSFYTPSLLGMDILGQCDFSYKRAASEFVLELPD